MGETRYSVQDARAVGESLIAELSSACERIEIMGSIRRRRPLVKDVELLAVSKVGGSLDLFGTTNFHALPLEVERLLDQGVVAKRKNSLGRVTYGEQNKLLVHCATGIPVDLFQVPVKNWGMAAVVRTGPAAFNIRLMARFRELGLRGHAYGGVTRPGPYGREGSEREEIDCPDEATVFDLAGWEYVEPWDRG